MFNRCGQNLCRSIVRAVLATKVEESVRAMAADGKTKALVFSTINEFQHQNYAFVPVHDSDHDGVVRIFIGHL